MYHQSIFVKKQKKQKFCDLQNQIQNLRFHQTKKWCLSARQLWKHNQSLFWDRAILWWIHRHRFGLKDLGTKFNKKIMLINLLLIKVKIYKTYWANRKSKEKSNKLSHTNFCHRKILRRVSKPNLRKSWWHREIQLKIR